MLGLIACSLNALLSVVAATRPQDEGPSVSRVLIDPDAQRFGDRGPSTVVEHLVARSGALHVWAESSELDPWLVVRHASGSERARDLGSGGGSTPYLRLDVQEGQELEIIVGSEQPARGGAARLHVVPAWESDQSLAAAEQIESDLGEVSRLQGEGQVSEARSFLLEIVAAAEALGERPASGKLAAAWESLALAADALNDPDLAARACLRGVRHLEHSLPSTHRELLRSQELLASRGMAASDFRDTLPLLRSILTRRLSVLPEDDADVQIARLNLAACLVATGQPQAAQPLLERAFAGLERARPPDHVDLQTACQNLGACLLYLGDLEGAREHLERSLEMAQRSYSEGHPNLQAARINLATALLSQGDHDPARELLEGARDVALRTYPGDHPLLLRTLINLGVLYRESGDVAAALPLFEHVLSVRESSPAIEERDLISARLNVADALRLLGRLEEALRVEEHNLEQLRRASLYESPEATPALANLLFTSALLGRHEDCTRLAQDLAQVLCERIEMATLTVAPRETEARAASLECYVQFLAAVGLEFQEPSIAAAAFQASEGLRGSGALGAWVLERASEQPDVGELRRRVSALASELVRLARTGADRDDLAQARRGKERLQAELINRLSTQVGPGGSLGYTTAEDLARALGEGQILVAYRVAIPELMGVSAEARAALEQRLMAFVVDGSGGVRCVDLGSRARIARAVESWRGAVSAAVERGASIDVDLAQSERAAGEELRELALDPVLSAAAGAKSLVVVLDDSLHLVPFDALPLEEGLVGERFDVRTITNCRDLTWPAEPPRSGELLVALGGAAFNSKPAASAERPAIQEAVGSTGAVVTLLRGGAWDRGFGPLPFTAAEVRDVTALHRGIVPADERTVVLEGQAASREALEALAPRARFLHLATHGWFAPESVLSTADREASSHRMTLQEQVRGASPMVLCGLALAGANLPADEAGCIAGLVTAEEISTWDLSACQLAVLSACDTNVGVRRAGQGVASLQKALHMAGARSVITSLWKVPDEATRELMVDFYRRLWVQGKSEHQALWEAKMRLRAARDPDGRPIHPTRDWAGWLLTGSLR